MNNIEKIAKAIQTHEGKPGDPNYRYNNPGNIVWGELTRSFGAKTYWAARTGISLRYSHHTNKDLPVLSNF